MRPEVRVGVLGSGEITKYHIEGLTAAGGCQLRSIASRTTAKAEEVARRYGFTCVAPDSSALLAATDVDAVVIATPVDTHGGLAIEAVRHGKPVLLQKPMARAAVQGREIVRAALSADVLLSVSFMHRYFEEVVLLQQVLQEGRLGRVYAARVRNATPGPTWNPAYYATPPADGVHGVVAELGVHGIDLVGHLLGEIRSVTATARQVHAKRVMQDGTVVESHVDDHVAATYETVDGITVVHEMDYAEVGGTDRFLLEVHGTRGSAVARGPRGPLAIHQGEHPGAPAGWTLPDVPPAPFGARHHRHFLDQVRGTAAPDGTAEAAVRGLCVAEAVLTAAATGGRVEVTYR